MAKYYSISCPLKYKLISLLQINYFMLLYRLEYHVGSTPRKVMNQGRGSKTAGCNKAWIERNNQ